MMKRGAVLINVARGEIVDTAALVAALESGHIAAATMDVYAGEFDGLTDAAHMLGWPFRVLCLRGHTLRSLL